MHRTDVAAAANARIERVVTYDVDRRGWALFARLSEWAARSLTTARAVVPPNAEFHGPIKLAPQSFAGMAPLGQVPPVAPANSEITAERSAGVLDSTHMRIFAERLRRGK